MYRGQCFGCREQKEQYIGTEVTAEVGKVLYSRMWYLYVTFNVISVSVQGFPE